AGAVFCTTGGPGEEVVCVNSNGDGAAGERNLPGEGTLPLFVDEVGSNCLALREVRGKFFSL
uniref:Predicted gene 10135 n=1 Tax=Cricetulus griseus TaxID=10029 RepID=A0A8C2LS85_CRIGR